MIARCDKISSCTIRNKMQNQRALTPGMSLAIFDKLLSFDNKSKLLLCSFTRSFSGKVSPFLENISSAQTLSLFYF